MTNTNTTAATIYTRIASAPRQMIRFAMIVEVDGAVIATAEGGDTDAMIAGLLADGIIASDVDFAAAADRPGWYMIPAAIAA